MGDKRLTQPPQVQAVVVPGSNVMMTVRGIIRINTHTTSPTEIKDINHVGDVIVEGEADGLVGVHVEVVGRAGGREGGGGRRRGEDKGGRKEEEEEEGGGGG